MSDAAKSVTGRPAWATFALALAVVLAHAAIWFARLAWGLPLALGLALATLVAYVAFTVMHEASHGNLHGDARGLKPLGELAGWLAGALLLAPFPAFRVLHLRHHSYTNHPEKDPDFWVAGRGLAVLARCLTIMPHYYVAFLVGEPSRAPQMKAERGRVLATVALFAIVLASLAVGGLAVEAIALWIAPGLIASAVLAFLFDWLPHHPHTSRVRGQDTRAIVMPGLPLLMLWQNYHLVHHLYPRVPFYAYGRLFHAEREALARGGSPIVDLLQRWRASGIVTSPKPSIRS